MSNVGSNEKENPTNYVRQLRDDEELEIAQARLEGVALVYSYRRDRILPISELDEGEVYKSVDSDRSNPRVYRKK